MTERRGGADQWLLLSFCLFVYKTSSLPSAFHVAYYDFIKITNAVKSTCWMFFRIVCIYDNRYASFCIVFHI